MLSSPKIHGSKTTLGYLTVWQSVWYAFHYVNQHKVSLPFNGFINLLKKAYGSKLDFGRRMGWNYM